MQNKTIPIQKICSLNPKHASGEMMVRQIAACAFSSMSRFGLSALRLKRLALYSPYLNDDYFSSLKLINEKNGGFENLIKTAVRLRVLFLVRALQ